MKAKRIIIRIFLCTAIGILLFTFFAPLIWRYHCTPWAAYRARHRIASPTFARLRADGCQMDAKHQIKTPRIVADSMHRLHEGIGLQSKRGPAVHTFVSNIA